MDREELIIAKYGVYPKKEDREEIIKLLIEEIENEVYSESHECLRVLCFLLFTIGNVKDCELIWKAKMLNMDAGCMIDGKFLCGAGYNETISYIGDRVELEKMKCYLRQYIGKEFVKEEVVNEFKNYYNIQ